MSRVAYFGREAAVKNSKVVGINFGFGSFNEHEHGVGGVASTLNYCRDTATAVKDYEIAKRYSQTPFWMGCIRSSFKPWHRTIQVDNSQRRLSLLESGEYDIIGLDDGNLTGYAKNRLEHRKKISEDEILSYEDYSFYVMSCPGKPEMPFAGMWDARSGALLFIKKNWEAHPALGDAILKSLKQGALAICDGAPDLFKSGGFSVVMLDRLYNM